MPGELLLSLPLPLLLSAVVLLAAVVIGTLRRRAVARLPRLQVAELASWQGPFRLTARIGGLPAGALRSPLTDRPCAAWRVEVIRGPVLGDGRRRDLEDQHVVDEQRVGPVPLVDDSGAAVVRLVGRVGLDLRVDLAEKSGPGRRPSAACAALLKRHEVTHRGRWLDQPLVAREGVASPGERVLLVGEVRRVDADGTVWVAGVDREGPLLSDRHARVEAGR